jgi:hypothetical protein
MTESNLETRSKRREGMGWRTGGSTLTVFGVVIADILWLFFYAGGFTVYQNIAVFGVIFLVFVAVNGAMWAPWAISHH